MPPPEPTLSDVLLRLYELADDLRTRIVDLRSDIDTLRRESTSFRLDTTTRLTRLFDELAAFRAEYNHPEPE